MAVKARSQDFKLENMRGSFLWLFKPQKNTDDNGNVVLKYNGTFLWPKTVELTAVTADKQSMKVADIAVQVATEAWGANAVELIKSGVIKNPFLDGDGPQGVSKKTGQRHDGFAGHKFLRASANEDRPPKLYLGKLGADGKLVEAKDPSSIYSGCYVHLVTNLFAWEHPKNGKGLSFGLNMVQFAKDGEKLGSGPADPDSFFEGVPGRSAATTAAASGVGAGALFA